MTQSCDVYFYEIATEIGITRMHDYLTRFGLGARTGKSFKGKVLLSPEAVLIRGQAISVSGGIEHEAFEDYL